MRKLKSASVALLGLGAALPLPAQAPRVPSTTDDDSPEVLKTYVVAGSNMPTAADAPGGIINIILKKDYGGRDGHTRWGLSPNAGHYDERMFSLVGGISDGVQPITKSGGYSRNSYILFRERPDIATYGATVKVPGVIGIHNSVPGGIRRNPAAAGGGDEFYVLAPGINPPPGGGSSTMQQLVAVGIYIDFGKNVDPLNGPAFYRKVYNLLNLAAHRTLREGLKLKGSTIEFDRESSDSVSGSGTHLLAFTQ